MRCLVPEMSREEKRKVLFGIPEKQVKIRVVWADKGEIDV
jgi:hypothetical protein